MTITASLFEETKGPLYGGPLPFACEQCKQRFFKSSCKSTNQSLDCFLQLHGWASPRNGPADEQGRFPGSSLLSSALASKDQGGSPDDASRLSALGSIRGGWQMLCPSRGRGRGQ